MGKFGEMMKRDFDNLALIHRNEGRLAAETHKRRGLWTNVLSAGVASAIYEAAFMVESFDLLTIGKLATAGAIAGAAAMGRSEEIAYEAQLVERSIELEQIK